ncbi:MAG: hypothetical protein JNM56_35600 [Planctomycetia bacterium]|nr:hypothetical protein [Planctomycetia bacterium]
MTTYHALTAALDQLAAAKADFASAYLYGDTDQAGDVLRAATHAWDRAHAAWAAAGYPCPAEDDRTRLIDQAVAMEAEFRRSLGVE